jgi:Sec-independent protein translocase protein TatA
LGAFTGRKVSSTTISRASTAMRGFSRAMDESKDVARAGDTMESIQKQIADLQVEFNNEIAALNAKIDPGTESFERISIKPDKSDILVQLVSLVWVPYWQDSQGNTTPAW